MNKGVKKILLISNSIILLLCVFWFFKDKEYEPVIVFITQIISILSITYESKFNDTNVKNIRGGSTIEIKESIKYNSKSSVEDVDNSVVKISKE